MAREADGTVVCSTSPDAKPGDEYRFLIRNGDAVLSRIDPYARAVTTSVGNGIVVDPTHDWHGGGFESAAVERARHLRDARRHLPPARRGDRRDLRRCDREARASEAARGERGADHAGDGVRRGRLLGLQPRPHLRRRERLRRPRGLQGLHRGRAPERDRRDPRRRLQPFRPERPRPLAVRRLERERQGRDLLLQRLAQRHPLGRHPPRLRTQRGPPVHPRQRALLAGGVPSRRAALRHDPLHPQRARRRGR